MARYAIPEPKIKTLPIVGKDEVFPVRRVYCIGRNYAAHAVEMGLRPQSLQEYAPALRLGVLTQHLLLGSGQLHCELLLNTWS